MNNSNKKLRTPLVISIVDYNLLTSKMHEATTIYLYGTGRAQMNVAEEAQRILLTMHKNIILLHDIHELKWF